MLGSPRSVKILRTDSRSISVKTLKYVGNPAINFFQNTSNFAIVSKHVLTLKLSAMFDPELASLSKLTRRPTGGGHIQISIQLKGESGQGPNEFTRP